MSLVYNQLFGTSWIIGTFQIPPHSIINNAGKVPPGRDNKSPQMAFATSYILTYTHTRGGGIMPRPGYDNTDRTGQIADCI